ncbi:MAG TPA: hypothetical protein DCY20_08955, partial [Firmicutes bacterium]|nr:hypothetical protein [Bacillota bacterium]
MMNKKNFKRLICLTTALSLTANTLTHAMVGGRQQTTYTSKGDYNFSDTLLRRPEGAEEKSKISDLIDTSTADYVSVIVEFASEPLAKANESSTTYSLKSRQQVARDHEVFNNYIATLPTTFGINQPKIEQSYSIVYNGVSLKIKANELEKIANCSVVKYIHADTEVSIETTTDESLVGMQEENNNTNESNANNSQDEQSETTSTQQDELTSEEQDKVTSEQDETTSEEDETTLE